MDRRVKKTKKAFNQALFTLLDQKPFQQITITDIVTEADVNRGTFYKHYRDSVILTYLLCYFLALSLESRA